MGSCNGSTTWLTDPVRVLDSRDPVDVGLNGPFASQVSQKLRVTGSIATTTGNKTVVPSGATGVLLNVTVVGASANGFVSIRPGDATGAPSTSSLNFNAGDIIPNAVLVALPTSGPNAGQIDITYDAFGASGPSTDLLVDVVGYSSSAKLDALEAALATKANSADVNTQLGNRYTKPESDARHLPQGDIVMGYGQTFSLNGNATPASSLQSIDAFRVSSGNGAILMNLAGPAMIGGIDYGLKSISYCLFQRIAPGFITRVTVFPTGPGPTVVGSVQVNDETDRSVVGCYAVPVNNTTATSFTFGITFEGGGGGLVDVRNVTATWAPASTIPVMLDQAGVAGSDGVAVGSSSAADGG